jgi:hypothetical protein
MPVTTGDQFAEALRQLSTSSPEAVRNVARLGRVAVTKQVQQTRRVDETVTENTVEKPKPPGAPACASDDTANTINCGSLDPATLEMSLDGGGTWVPLVTTGHTGNKSVRVRVKATATTLASPATTLTFTEVAVPPGVDSPTTIQLDVTGITTNSANLLCNLVDLDGVTGTCTVIDLDSNNSVVYSGPITPTVVALTLKPDRNYQAQVSGTAQKKNPDNSLTAVPVNQVKNFKTNAEVAPDPAPVSAPIGTITVGDNGGMPTSYTLPAVVDAV